ncbi:MAG: hypothetical protein ACYC7J_03875 [Syntrophales bacterium]
MKRNYGLYLTIALCLAVTACAGLFRNYGRIDASDEVTAAFTRYEVNPNYRYYISGADFHPNALMGLDRKYRIDPETLWREVPGMTPARMKEIVDWMRVRAFRSYDHQYGFEMRAPDGRQIGVWYSILIATTFVRMNEDGTVRIDTPDPDTYRELSREDGNREH